MGCSSSSANTTIEPSNTNDAPVQMKGKAAAVDNSANAATSPATPAAPPTAAAGDDNNGDKLSRQQSRAEGQPKEGVVVGVSVATKSGAVVAVVEPSTIPNTPVTLSSRTIVSAIDTNNAVNNNDLLSSPSLPSDRPLAQAESVASSSSASSATSSTLRPASATITSSLTKQQSLSTPGGRRVASAGTLRHPVLASLGGAPATLSPIADTPATPTSPAAVGSGAATVAAPPSIASPARPTNKTDNNEEKKESTEGMALVAGEKVALRPIAASHQATLTKTAVNRQAMFIPWEKPALGKPTAAAAASGSGNSDEAGARPTTSSGRKLAAVPPNLDRLMNKTHKPSKHKREQMAAAAAAAASSGSSDGESKSKSGDLMIIGSAINGNSNSEANKENKENSSSGDESDEKKSKRPQPLKRRLAPLAPLKGVPVSPANTNTAKAVAGNERPTTSSGRPTTSSGRPGTAHTDTVSAMRRDRDRAATYSNVMRQLNEDCNLPEHAATLILKLANIKPSATNFEMVKPKQPPAWEIRF